MDNELALLGLYIEEEEPTPISLENSMNLLLDGIDRQLATAASIRSDWTRMKGDIVLNCDRPQEQVIVLNKILRAAEMSKEKIVQLSYKYFLTRKWYESLSDPIRCNSWIELQRRVTDISAILSTNNGELKRLGPVIREVETELIKAEQQQQIHDSKLYDQAETHKKMAFTLQRTIQRQHDEIVALKQKIDELEAMRLQKEEQQRQLQQVLEQAKGREVEEEISDKAYLERMIEEVEDDRMEDLPNVEDTSSGDEDGCMEEIPTLEQISSDEEDNRVDDHTSLNRLQEDLWKIKKVLKKFPYRMIGDTKGVASDKPCAFCGKTKRHFSDSCPKVTNGNERYHIVSTGKLCVHCLDNCPKHKCKFKPRSCWYCDRVRGTIAEDMIPEDNGHHKALCSVADSRSLLVNRIASLKKEIEERRARSRGRECRRIDP
ncbi:unnamed protein product [Haemonchus placei]|uniref:CCHC-type domain-containing protein n=1 Tax=Haemonchus placei TaxID=6290 RepID=A0A0N4WDR6_HAEPC|nr:unnamed protein product [Haemonchus placei]